MINRIKKSLTAIPASVSEAASYVISIGEKQREINKIKRETKAEVDRLNAQATQKIDGLKKDRDIFFVALFAFAQPRQAELTKDARSLKTYAGTFGWRWTPPAVELAEGKTDAQVIAQFEKLGLNQFVRVIKELDREAMLKDRPMVAGVSYTQRDEFFAKPKLKKEDGKAEELVKVTEAIDN